MAERERADLAVGCGARSRRAPQLRPSIYGILPPTRLGRQVELGSGMHLSDPEPKTAGVRVALAGSVRLWSSPPGRIAHYRWRGVLSCVAKSNAGQVLRSGSSQRKTMPRHWWKQASTPRLCGVVWIRIFGLKWRQVRHIPEDSPNRIALKKRRESSGARQKGTQGIGGTEL